MPLNEYFNPCNCWAIYTKSFECVGNLRSSVPCCSYLTSVENIVRDLKSSTLRQQRAETLVAKTGTVLEVIDFAIEAMRGGAQQIPRLAGDAKTRITDQRQSVMQRGAEIMDQLHQLPQHLGVE